MTGVVQLHGTLLFIILIEYGEYLISYFMEHIKLFPFSMNIISLATRERLYLHSTTCSGQLQVDNSDII